MIHQCTCKLDGVKQQVRYHMACQPGRFYWLDARVHEYIGDGVVYSAYGVLQYSTVRLSFFKLRADRPKWAR